MTTRTQRFYLQGVHFLYDPVHVEPKHGHEYSLQVTVGTEISREDVEIVVTREILKPWDKKDWTTMGLQQASGELLVERFDEDLRKSSIGPWLRAVVLKETRKNRFVSSRSDLADCE